MTIVAVAFLPFKSSTAVANFSAEALSVWERMIHPAFSTWSLKKSPKFFMYILHLEASTTVQNALSCAWSSLAFATALITSLSLPTPEGSIRMRSGAYCATTCCNALEKSPTREQQIQPEFISVTLIPASCKNPPSIPISPNSFSINTTFSPA